MSSFNLAFYDEKIGYLNALIENENIIFRTDDGGKNWTKRYSEYPILKLEKKMFILDTNNIYISDKEKLMLTNDSFKSIKQINTIPKNISGMYITKLHSYFLTSNALYRIDNINDISELQKEMRDVYPNPAIKGNRIKINVDGNSYLSKIILTDINGIIIDQQSISNTEFFEYYIPYNISNGVYFLNIFSANNYETIKIIVE